jgi:hypothetical protein
MDEWLSEQLDREFARHVSVSDETLDEHAEDVSSGARRRPGRGPELTRRRGRAHSGVR